MKYYDATGIFPIMHVIAIRRAVFERYPWVAMNLFKAFEQAKERSLERMNDLTASRIPVPWAASIAGEWGKHFGAEPFPYGLEANRKTLDAFCRFAHAQGITAQRLTPDDLFPQESARKRQGVISLWHARRRSRRRSMITTRVPATIWVGTMVRTPFDSIAGLNEPEAVCPFIAGSVSVISSVTFCGISIETGDALVGGEAHHHAFLQVFLGVADHVVRHLNLLVVLLIHEMEAVAVLVEI